MDPLGLVVMGIIIVLVAISAIIPSRQRKKAEQEES